MNRLSFVAVLCGVAILATLVPSIATPTETHHKKKHHHAVVKPVDIDATVVETTPTIPKKHKHPAKTKHEDKTNLKAKTRARVHKAPKAVEETTPVEAPVVSAAPAAPIAAASTIGVLVDDRPVTFVGAGPQRVNGSVLVPLRGIFEKLGATVLYHSTTKTFEATKGTTYLILRVGDSSAYINNAPVPLAQPAIVTEGTAMVPLRIVAQALGATVKWDADKQIVTIKTQPVAAPVHHFAAVGQIVAIAPDANPAKITVHFGDQTSVVTLATDTLILVQKNKEAAAQASLASLLPGDQIRVTRISEDSPASVVSIHFDEVSGVLKDIVRLPDGSRVVILDDASNAQLSTEATVTSEGRPIAWEGVHAGAIVAVRIDPVRKVGYALTVKGVPPPPVAIAPERTVTINSFRIDAAGPLKGGDTLKATLRGSENAKAEVTIPGVVESIPMTEESAGVYQCSYVIPAGLNANGATVIGKLSAPGAVPVMIQAAQSLVIDSKAPAIANGTPSSTGQVSSGRPRISATLDDGPGSGVDPSATRMFIDGRDVTSDAISTQQFVTYEPKEPLADGEHRVRVVAADVVGNTSELTWKFTINANSGLVANLQSNLPSGDSHISSTRPLHVTLHAQPGGAAVFSVGDVATGIAMKETSPGVYEGDFAPDRTSSAHDVEVTAKFTATNGAVMVTTLSSPVTIDAAVPVKPTITSPKPDDAVPGHVVISGTSAPNATILIKVRYRSPGVADLYKNSGTSASTQIQADANGNWHTQDLDLSTGGIFPTKAGTVYTVTAVVVDATGQLSDADVVKFRQQ